MSELTFTHLDLLEKSQGICYLTGRTIDFTNSRSYNLDHRIARSKGGLNTLENCEVASKEANQAKSDLSQEEFFKLCVDVVLHNKLMVGHVGFAPTTPALEEPCSISLS